MNTLSQFPIHAPTISEKIDKSIIIGSIISNNFDGNNLEIKNEFLNSEISTKSFAFSTLVTLGISVALGLLYFI